MKNEGILMFEPLLLLLRSIEIRTIDVPGGRRERQYHRDEKEQSERQRQEQLEQFRKQYAGLRDETEKNEEDEAESGTSKV